MNGENVINCKVCGATMLSEREQHMLVCYECRRYGLLNGCWPVHDSLKPTEGSLVRTSEIHVD